MCVWAILFAAPHVWWALGIPAGFPGGEANHRLLMSSAWRYVADLVVILLSGLAVVIGRTLLRPPRLVAHRWVPLTAAWIGAGLLLLRGLAGGVVDGASDPIWWPTFLVGGILLGVVAWSARGPREAPIP